MSMPGETQGAYAFAAKPRAVGSSKRFRKPGLSLMSDRRVVRGRTVPKPVGIQMHRTQGPQSSRVIATRFIPPTKPSIFNLKPEQEDHIPVNLEANLVEAEKVVAVVDIETQTDEFEPLPPPAPYVPKKTGVDVGTQVDLEELFDFDMEVGPILDVIVSKTLEQARMEVEEEEELSIIRAERLQYDEKHQAEVARIALMEAQQKSLFDAKQERVAHAQERVAKEETVFRKVGSVQLIKAVLAELHTRVFDDLTESGFFPDMREEEVKHDFMPWLIEKTATLVEQQSEARILADDLIENALAIGQRRHRERKCYIRVVVNVGAATHVVGPIVVAGRDTVATIHDRIASWLQSRGTNLETLGGPIRLAYGSPPEPLNSEQILLSIRGLDLNQLHVSVELPEGAADGAEDDQE